jgi:hypothetical protein
MCTVLLYWYTIPLLRGALLLVCLEMEEVIHNDLT